MIKRFFHPFTFTLLTVLLVILWTDVTTLEALAISVFFYALFNFTHNFSKNFVFIDIIILIASLQWLLMPVISYNVFNKHNELSKIWDVFMKVDSVNYFSYVLPASMLFFIGLTIPLRWKTQPSSKYYINSIKEKLHNKGHIAVILTLIGFVFTVLNPFLPKIVQGFVNFFAQLTFIGIFYSYYSNYKFKSLFLAFGIVILVSQSILTGMYGELVFWLLLFFTLALVDKKISFFKKVTLMMCGLFIVFLIQSIKHEYRQETWGAGMVRGSDAALFSTLLIDRLSDPLSIFAPERTFNLVTRGNQGYLIGKVMNYVPKNEPFANGETIFKSIVSSFVPRLLWPDKPMIGDNYNAIRFLGTQKGLNYSFDISPVGEAYANFDKIGGVVFMFFFGIFLNFINIKILSIAVKYPSLILWMPIIYLGCIQGIEGSVLTSVNSIIKALFFTWAMYFSFRLLFKIRL